MHEMLASPGLCFVGRHNSGKTTIVVAVIAELVRRGLDVGSIKHHGHRGFDIDVPGKDSYRHRHAGASETVVAAPDVMARIATLPREQECSEILATMPGHDVVVVEGYRASGLPRIEVMRQGNHRDLEAASDLLEFGFDSAEFRADAGQVGAAEGEGNIVGVATDIPGVADLARRKGLPVFELAAADSPAFPSFIAGLCDFIQARFTRPKVTVAIQAGGESRRMGTSKALADFNGEPLVARLVRRLAPAADEIIITTHGGDDLDFLANRFPTVNVRVVPDVCEQRGTLAGLLTAFEAAAHEVVAVVACDMAFAAPTLVAAEVDRLVRTGAGAVAPLNAHGFEPLHAVYDRDTCAPVARRLVEQGDLRARDLLEQVGCEGLTQDDVRQAVPMGGCFANANTPDELEKLRALDQHRA